MDHSMMFNIIKEEVRAASETTGDQVKLYLCYLMDRENNDPLCVLHSIAREVYNLYLDAVNDQ